MEINIFLFICFFGFVLMQYKVTTDFESIIKNINENSIDSTDSKTIIDSTKILMNEYPFINILKDPPEINGNKNYFQKVDIINELDKLQSNFEKNPYNYYKYYQEYLKIIRLTNDLHIGFSYDSYNSINLTETIIISPFYIRTDENKKSYLEPNYLINYLEIEEEVPNFNRILEKKNAAIKSINDKDPFVFIRNFCKDYITFKNINAKFSFTKYYLLESYFYLSDCPLNSDEFKLNIIFEDEEESIDTSMIALLDDEYENDSNNQIYEYFMNFLKKEKENKKKGILTNRKLLKNYLKSK